jgi:hypothetical protein
MDLNLNAEQETTYNRLLASLFLSNMERGLLFAATNKERASRAAAAVAINSENALRVFAISSLAAGDLEKHNAIITLLPRNGNKSTRCMYLLYGNCSN